MRPEKIILSLPPENERDPNADLYEIVIPTEWIGFLKHNSTTLGTVDWENIIEYMCDETEDLEITFEEYELLRNDLGKMGIWTPNIEERDEIGAMAGVFRTLGLKHGFHNDWVVVYDRNLLERFEAMRADVIGDRLKIDPEESIRIDLNLDSTDEVLYIPKGLYYIRKFLIVKGGDCINVGKQKIFDLLQTK